MKSGIPRCGCEMLNNIDQPTDAMNDDCLYPTVLAQYEKCSSDLAEAEAIVRRLILDSSWSGDPAVIQAEEFLKRVLNVEREG